MYYQKLYALNLTTGNDLLPPATIRDTVSGTGTGSVGGRIGFDALLQFFRPNLLLVNNRIYMGSGSHCDNGNYHGWLFAYNAADLSLAATRCISPNDTAGSVWQYGGGLSSDGSNVYCVSGNGSFNASRGSYGMSVLKLDSLLTIRSYFTPYNYGKLNDTDLDLSSSVMLIPGTGLCTVQGKPGGIWVMKKDTLGGFHASGDSIVQRIDKAYPRDPGGGNPVAAFWNNLFFLWTGNDSAKAFAFDGTKLVTPAQSKGTVKQSGTSGAITLSANGTINGILWGTNVSTGRLYAFNASQLSTMLWNDGQAANNRDKLGSSVQRPARPTVANGKVFVPTVNSLVVYGLLPGTGVRGETSALPAAPLVARLNLSRRAAAVWFNAPGPYELTVSDMLGRVLTRARGQAATGYEQLPLAGGALPPGACIVTIRSGNRVASMKTMVE